MVQRSEHSPSWRNATRAEIEAAQLCALNSQCQRLAQANDFYRMRLDNLSLPLENLEQFKRLPWTTKEELVADSPAGLAANHTWPPDAYQRMHQTSGSRGSPMVVLDTAADWQWWIDVWQDVLDVAEITSDDRVLMAFSFGPFIGFWSAFEAVAARGALMVPGGGMSSLARLDLLQRIGATAVFCTPSYAMHLAGLAQQHNIPLAHSAVRVIVVAGEPGGSVPAIKSRIESAWGARVVDHAGATEVGPWGFADPLGKGLHVNERYFIAEFKNFESESEADEGEMSELVLTSLGRQGCPVLRYRTGDLVRPYWNHDFPCPYVWLEGGVLGRTDDMMIIRGVNIYPSAIEQVLREVPEIDEYRMTVSRAGAMDELLIEVEDSANDPQRVATHLQWRLGLRVDVRCVAQGSLPRFEAKARRFVDGRTTED